MTEVFIPDRDSLADHFHNPECSIAPEDGSNKGKGRFFEAEEVRELIRRSTFYLEAGTPVHFQGAAGIGKTALAQRVASQIGRPVSLMTGHAGLNHQDFLGRTVGHSETNIVDKYIQSVRRTDTKRRVDWQDAILAEAMEQGHTLIYDEFTRASPEANVSLLSVLEEGLLVSTDRASNRPYLHAHPDFRMILTSNPDEYAGVNDAPDALFDRMVTFNLEGYSADTEAGILQSNTAVERDLAEQIVAVIRDLRELPDTNLLPSMRTALLIARIAAHQAKRGGISQASLTTIITDVVRGRDPSVSPAKLRDTISRTLAAATETV